MILGGFQQFCAHFWAQFFHFWSTEARGLHVTAVQEARGLHVSAFNEALGTHVSAFREALGIHVTAWIVNVSRF